MVSRVLTRRAAAGLAALALATAPPAAISPALARPTKRALGARGIELSGPASTADLLRRPETLIGDWISLVMELLTPFPMDINAITAATPMIRSTPTCFNAQILAR